ncbi:hypothetical protein EOL94_00910 [bacterium]|nr:hypothetical protein [bacterium]
MFKKNKNKKKTMIIILILIIGFFWFFKIKNYYPDNIDLKTSDKYIGVTFSTKFSEELGLNWQDTYLNIIDDLKVKNIRIPVYWDEVEKDKGVYDFSKYDFIIKEGSKRDVNFIFNLGYRLPRWPECHFPEWADCQVVDEDYLLKYIETAVNRYKSYDNIVYWQIENEPFLSSFGICPKLNKELLKKEIDIIKENDQSNRKIIISSSGELGSWKKEKDLADVLGTTMYRIVYNPFFGFIKYPFGSKFYKIKANILKINKEDIIISELQAEPWVSKGTMNNLSKKDIDKSLSINQFKANIQTAINSDFKQVYLWGVEWWYFQKVNNNPEYWNIIKDMLKNNK